MPSQIKCNFDVIKLKLAQRKREKNKIAGMDVESFLMNLSMLYHILVIQY